MVSFSLDFRAFCGVVIGVCAAIGLASLCGLSIEIARKLKSWCPSSFSDVPLTDDDQYRGTKRAYITTYLSLLATSGFVLWIATEPFWTTSQPFEYVMRDLLQILVINQVAQTVYSADLPAVASGCRRSRAATARFVWSIVCTAMSVAIIAIVVYSFWEPKDSCLVGCNTALRVSLPFVSGVMLFVSSLFMVYDLASNPQRLVPEDRTTEIAVAVYIVGSTLLSVGTAVSVSFSVNERHEFAVADGDVYGKLDRRVESWFVASTVGFLTTVVALLYLYSPIRRCDARRTYAPMQKPSIQMTD